MQTRYLPIFFLGWIFWSCQSSPSPHTTEVPPVAADEHCYTGASPYGTHADYLIADFLEAIDRIQPDPTMAKSQEGMVDIKGGQFQMGGDNAQARPDEYPKHTVEVKDFWMDATEVTNAQFRRFVDATGYVTVAERAIDLEELKKQVPPGTELPSAEDLQPFSLVFTSPPSGNIQTLSPADWWQMVKGATGDSRKGPAAALKAGQSPRGTRLLVRCHRLLQMGGQTPAHRSGMGIRWTRWPKRGHLSLGHGAGICPKGQFFSGRISSETNQRRWLSAFVSCQIFCG